MRDRESRITCSYIMKSYKKYLEKTAAALLIASMMTVQVSTFALADTQTPVVEITDFGPVGTSTTDNSISLIPSGESAAAETTAADNSTTVTVTGTSMATGSGTVSDTTTQTPAETTAAAGTSTADISASGTAVTSAAGTTSAGAATTNASSQNNEIISASTDAAANTAAVDASNGTSTTASTDSTTTGSTTLNGTNFFQTTGGNSFLQTTLTAHPEVNANFAILVDADSNLVVAEKNSESKMYPASMTKVMTLLVACEHLTNLSDEVEITSDIVKYVNDNDASNCGFKAGEKVTVQDLLYGLILPSGADAALALVRYIAGSEEQFVNLMNQKAQELGISATTHYTNSTGLYNDNHYTTAKDMALVMKYAAANPYASAILSTRSYTTKPNNKRSTGLTFSNLFLKRIDSQSTGGTTLMAKTGYVSKAGNCAVSCFTGASGKHYILVTGKTSGAWNVVYAHRDLYKTYGK